MTDDTPLFSNGDDIASIYLEAVERTKKQGYNPDASSGEEGLLLKLRKRINNCEQSLWFPLLRFY